jgi:hypothetical protein
MVIKNAEFYADSKSVEKMARNHTGKVINDKTFISFWLYGFPRAFFISKETPTAGWRYEKERHSAGLDVSKLHLVQGRVPPLHPPPLTPHASMHPPQAR